MSIQRRDILKLPLLALASTSLVAKTAQPTINDKLKVVIVGGGFGGLSVAKQLRLKQKDIEITVIDKNQIFMTGPMFNLMLGEVKGVHFETIMHDREVASNRYNYTLKIAEVYDIDREIKKVYTTKGVVDYDYLVLSPGISYDYEKQFPKWDKEKILRARLEAPAGLIPGDEFLRLFKNLKAFKGGNIVLSVPLGDYRCPPAPYERACMFAQYIRTNKLDAKVIVIDNYSRPVSKTKAFEEAFNTIYKDIIDYRGDCTLEDVDFDKQKVIYSFWGEGSGDDGDMKEIDYNFLNLIANNKGSEVIKMAKIKTLGWGSAKLQAPTYQSVTDKDIYVVGDCVGYAFPESGQMANNMGHICANHISQRIDKKPITKEMPSNMCASMVQTNPNEAISDSHSINFDGNKFKVTPFLAFNERTHLYRSEATSDMLFSWYHGIISDMLD